MTQGLAKAAEAFEYAEVPIESGKHAAKTLPGIGKVTGEVVQEMLVRGGSTTKFRKVGGAAGAAAIPAGAAASSGESAHRLAGPTRVASAKGALLLMPRGEQRGWGRVAGHGSGRGCC
jgi:hypothetical protein